jgi:sterol desaturase/sphingolipid hydroxylase (fatty acid hydroxylase superfamily)
VVAWYLVLSAGFSQLEHANVRWAGPGELLVRTLFVTPHMHKWHHSRDVRETDTNYGNILSVWDRAFGTFTGGADPSRVRYGLEGLPQGSPHSLGYLLRLPFAR